MSDLNALHTAEARAQLLEQFQNSEDLKALLSVFVDQVQDLENATQPIIDARDIDTMTGDRLDGLGEIVNVSRGGTSDTAYRLRIRAELAILRSNGSEADLVNILLLLLAMDTKDIQFDEYYPKTVYMRPRNTDIGANDMSLVNTLMRRATPVGTELHIIYSTAETDDDNVFRFSDTSGTPELASTKGFGNGTLDGVQ
jgi:hypothetical protein